MMLKKINVFLNQKFKIQLLFIVIFGFTISLMELIGIGLIPFFVGILTQKEKFLDFIPITNFKDYLYSFNEFNLFLFFSFFIVLVFLIKNILIFLLNYLENKIYLNIVVFNSSRLMKYYINSSYQLHLERNSSKFLRNLSHDTEATADLINSLVKIFREILMGLLILALLLKTNPSITIFSVGVLSIITFAVYLLIKKKIEKFGQSTREFLANKIQVISNAFSSIKEIKIIGNEKKVFQNYENSLIGYHAMKAKFNVVNTLPRLSLEFISVTVLLGIVVILNNQSNNGLQELLPILTLTTISIIKLSPIINNINSSFSNISFSKTCMENVYNEFEKLGNYENSLNLSSSNQMEKNLETNNKNIKVNFIEFKNVSFKYPSNTKPILEDINFKLSKNQIIGIIGSTGSGKTTLVDILLGLLKPLTGNVFFDNTRLSGNEKKLRKLMSYVPQNPFLLNDSIINNIIFNNDFKKDNFKNKINSYEKEKLEEVIEICQLKEVINNLPNKIFENTGNLGIKLSGGQRQRIAIARALYLDRDIIVLDEATNALDSVTEKMIMNKIYDLKKNKIIINISHRINEMIKYDNFLIIDNNKVNVIGSYENLKTITKQNFF